MVNKMTPSQFRSVGFSTAEGYRRTCSEHKEIQDVITSVIGEREKHDISSAELKQIKEALESSEKTMKIIEAVENELKAKKAGKPTTKRKRVFLDTPYNSDSFDEVTKSNSKLSDDCESSIGSEIHGPRIKRVLKKVPITMDTSESQEIKKLKKQVKQLYKIVQTNTEFIAHLHSSAHDIATTFPFNDSHFYQ